MKLQELLKQIESVEFAAYLGVASGFSVVMLGLENSDTLAKLVNELQNTPEYKYQVIERLVKLLKVNDAPQNRHRYDLALTAYLYALNRVDAELAQQAIDAILQTPNLFWARRLARHIREQATIP